MAAIPYIPLYIADYLSDTAYLDATESGAYLHLIFNYWQTGKPIKDDDKRLARIAKLTGEEWMNVRSTIVQFFILKEGYLTHKRLDKDLRTFEEKSKKASKAGKKSGEARRDKALKESNSYKDSVNVRLTNVERTLNNTDTDTDTDTSKRLKIKPSSQEKKTITHVDKTTGEVVAFDVAKVKF